VVIKSYRGLQRSQSSFYPGVLSDFLLWKRLDWAGGKSQSSFYPGVLSDSCWIWVHKTRASNVSIQFLSWGAFWHIAVQVQKRRAWFCLNPVSILGCFLTWLAMEKQDNGMKTCLNPVSILGCFLTPAWDT